MRRSEWRYLVDVVGVLVGREFKARYQGATLGVAWSLISPLLFLVTFYFVFKVVLDLGIPRYASFAFIGILAWSWFQGALNEAVSGISANAGLVGQPGFPVATLPVAAVMLGLINFAVALPVLFAVLVVEGARPQAWMLALPVLAAVQFVLTLGFALLVAALNVHYRDTRQILPVILQLGYYVTPIFYDPDKLPHAYAWVFMVNPMSHLVQAYRAVLLDGGPPDWLGLCGVTAFSMVLLAGAYAYFRQASRRFLEEI